MTPTHAGEGSGPGGDPQSTAAARAPVVGLYAVAGTGMRATLDVDLAAAPGDLLTGQRTRLAECLDRLSAQGWRRPTRCPLWDVADVVTHLGDATGWALGALAAADTGTAPPEALEGFDPGTTPHEHVLAGRGQAPRMLLARLRETTGTVAGRLAAAERAGAALIPWVARNTMYSPGLAGLHLLWDSWLHELDLVAALDAEGIARAAPCPAELDAVAAYAVFFAGLVARRRLSSEEQVLLRAELGGLAYDLRLGPVVHLSRAVGDPAPDALVLRGPAAQTVEALAGRGELADAAEGHAPAIALLAGLGARMRVPADHAPAG